MAEIRPLSLDDLIALCEEASALARSGVPLERGLLSIAEDLPQPLASTASTMALRGEAGASLEQIVTQDARFPPIFQAVVRAGTRSGRLSIALEGLYVSAKRAADLRRDVGLAILYPLIVLIIIAVISFQLFRELAMTFAQTGQNQDVHPPVWFNWIVDTIQIMGGWFWLIPGMLVAFALAWWLCTKQAASAQPAWFAVWMSWVPWTGRLLRLGRLATFIDVLALLVQQKLPLHQAILLAADACGDPRIQAEASQLATRIEKGQPTYVSGERPGAIPALVRWQLGTRFAATDMVGTLQSSGATYHRQAENLAEWIRIQLPVVLTIFIGGTATLIYALAILAPWYSMITQLAVPL